MFVCLYFMRWYTDHLIRTKLGQLMACTRAEDTGIMLFTQGVSQAQCFRGSFF